MAWIAELQSASPAAYAVLTVSLVSALGLTLGSFAWRGLSLGTAGVLSAGILFGHLGWRIDDAIRDFAREFGLVLFVFTIGCSWDPGSERRSGTRACA